MAQSIPIFLFGDESTDYYPLSLGLLRASLSKFGGPEFQRNYRFMGVLNQSEQDALRVAKAFGPGIWLFSDYLWNWRSNLRFSRLLKELNPKNLTIHGGPSVPKYEGAFQDFWRANPHVDIAVRGEGELTVTAVLLSLLQAREWHRLEADLLSEVPGITFSTPDSGLVRCPERPRIQELDELPSPYLNDIFKAEDRRSWVVESNRGCPYSCTFCDWGSLTAQKIKMFDMDRVKAELEWGAQRKLRSVFLADANFGIFPRDLEIAAHLGKLKERFGYPKDVNVNFAKNSTERVAEIVRAMRASGIYVDSVLAIQSRDSATLHAIGRKNISTQKYDQLTDLFRAQGLEPTTDLMVRLPGQTYQSFKTDLQDFMDKDIRVLIHPTLFLPNSPMASPEYQREWQLEVDEQGRVIASSSFSQEEGEKMLALRVAYFFSEFYSFFRYIMRYLQWEHKVLCGDFLDAMVEEYPWFSSRLREEEKPYDFTGYISHWELMESFHSRSTPLYDRVKDWVCQKYDLALDDSLQTVFQLNESLVPKLGRIYPHRVDLAHDFIAYYRDKLESGSERPLSSYPPSSFEVSERFDGHAARFPSRLSARDWVWELDSPLLDVRGPRLAPS